MDDDLAAMTPEQLRAEVIRLRAAIREHRDQQGHDLCWYQPELWGVLPEQLHPSPAVPDWCEFMQRCAEYRKSLDER